jgi:hypothetical protein
MVNSGAVPSRRSSQMPRSVRRKIVSPNWTPTPANRRYFRSTRFFWSSRGNVAGFLGKPGG